MQCHLVLIFPEASSTRHQFDCFACYAGFDILAKANPVKPAGSVQKDTMATAAFVGIDVGQHQLLAINTRKPNTCHSEGPSSCAAAKRDSKLIVQQCYAARMSLAIVCNVSSPCLAYVNRLSSFVQCCSSCCDWTLCKRSEDCCVCAFACCFL